ncbi:MAG: hypothetical protein JWO82_1374 [Akkermansiaceae bacterium]|nr:hypothetical protein [Akkermansiaceae bacterium]
MRLWTLIKIVAGAAVISVGSLTCLLVWHSKVQPVGGAMSKIMPTDKAGAPVEALPQSDASMPDVDPGAKIFEKVKELIAVGDFPAAREKLETIVTTYPRSKAAPEARRIVGEMNMDDLLSPANMEGKTMHTVAKGESFLGIAAKYKTSIDCIMHLNGMLELTSLHPGDELVVMPLDLRLLIEPSRKAMSLWKGPTFIKEYNLLAADAGNLKATVQTTIAGSYGQLGDKRMNPSMKGYRDSVKIFTLTKSALKIRSAKDEENSPQQPGAGNRGFLLNPEDAEELSLIIRPGNEVEIRTSAP